MSSQKIIYATIIGAVTIAGVILYVGLANLQKIAQAQKPIVGAKEIIRIKTPTSTVEVEAKIDTGADSSAIDEEYAKSIGLDLTSKRKKTIVNARGRDKRDVIDFSFTLGNKTITTEATLADREDLSTKALIGRQDLEGFIIDPEKEFLIAPTITNQTPSQRKSLINFLGTGQENRKILLVFPVLGALIVVERLLIGFRTFGIFGPVAIAYSLITLGIGSGIFLYAVLLLVGLLTKIFILKKFQLPLITEMALLMFLLTSSLIAVRFFQDYIPFLSLTPGFIPLIIATYLIENAGKAALEYGIIEVLGILFSTMAVAVLLAILGNYMLSLSPTLLSIIFFAAIPTIILVSYYRGLRISELIRFRTYSEPKKVIT